jgi:hypothetical protein
VIPASENQHMSGDCPRCLLDFRLPLVDPKLRLNSRRGGRMSRRDEAEDSATWQIGARPQSSVMRFDNRPADRQPKPQTARFRGVERFEDALQTRRRTTAHLRGEEAAREGVPSDDCQLGVANRNSPECRLLRSITSVPTVQAGVLSKSIQLEARP